MINGKDILSEALDLKSFESIGHKLIELLRDDMKLSQESIDHKTIDWLNPDEQLSLWKEDFLSKEPAEAIDLFKKIMDKSIKLSRKGYIGHQVAPVYPISVLSSALSAYLNNGMAVYEMGMSGNAMEKIIITDLANRFGLPNSATGFVTSGGSLGNLTALLAARAIKLNRYPDLVYNKLAVMVSEEAHYSIERAMIVMGLPLDNIIKIKSDSDFRINIDNLETGILTAEDKGLQIFCVIGCACSTSTGAYDDLKALGDFCKLHDLWFHVDAAHGGPAIYSDRYKNLLIGIEQADSVIMDFHKMMHVPSLSTAVIFRTAAHHALTFYQDAKYLWDDQSSEEWYNSGKQTFECTKPMSIIHIYTALRIYGEMFYEQHINKLYGLATDFAKSIKEKQNFDLLCTPQSNIVCFRFNNGSDNLNDLNKIILRELTLDGRFYLVSTKAGNDFYLRTSIMNPRTELNDLELLLLKINEIADKK